MQLVTISKELNDMDAQMKRSQLEAAGFHPLLANEDAALWLGTAIPSVASRCKSPNPRPPTRRNFSTRRPRPPNDAAFQTTGTITRQF
jgi:hypothetical protein